jgi:hypothetical protein
VTADKLKFEQQMTINHIPCIDPDLTPIARCSCGWRCSSHAKSADEALAAHAARAAYWDDVWQKPGVGSRKETLLGYTKYGNEIIYWEGYGVVCPDEITTNGSLWAMYRACRPPAVLTPPGAAFFLVAALWTFRHRDDQVACLQRWRADHDRCFHPDGSRRGEEVQP